MGRFLHHVEDDRFLTTLDEFCDWADERKSLRMEFFYRDLRRKYNILMEGTEPVDGTWNYDIENSRPPKDSLSPPRRHITEPDHITNGVLSFVAEQFNNHFGRLDRFDFAVSRDGALAVLDSFITERLSMFGTYQDAMVDGEP